MNWDNLFQEEASFVPIESNIESASYFSKRPGDDESFVSKEEELSHDGASEFDTFQFKNLKLLHEVNVVKSKAQAHSIASLPTVSLVADSSTKKLIKLKDDRPILCLVAEDNPVTQLLAKALMQQLGITLTQV